MIDLHLHSHASDGLDAPGTLADMCRQAGLTVMALTDHDTTAGWDEAAAAAVRCGLEFVPGVEITAVLDGRDVHILGYFPSRQVPLLDGFLREQRDDRVRRVREMAARLETLGFPLDIAPSLDRAARQPGRSAGRPMLADAMIAAGYVQNRDEAFARYLGHGCPAFVPRIGSSPSEVIELIMAAGGIAALAHPGLLDRDEIIPSLVISGLPALEVYHSDHDAETTERYRRLAVRSGMLVTGGSDFHGAGAKHRGCAIGRVCLPREYYDALRQRLFA